MISMQTATVVVGLISGLAGLAIYLYKFSKNFSKLDNITVIEEKLDAIKASMVDDLVSRSVLTQRVNKLEEELKCARTERGRED